MAEVDLRGVVALDDFEPLAKVVLSEGAYAYYSGGSWDEVTLKDNVAAFRRRKLRPRVLVDVATVDATTTLLGQPVQLPVGLAPTAAAGLAHGDGEVATAAAAAAAGVVHCQSTISSRSIEDIAATGGTRWFQLYVAKDRSISEDLVKRAAAAGCKAIVLTVDLPVGGYRQREMRTRFESLTAFGNFPIAQGEGELFQDFIASLNDQTLTWDDLAWLRSLSDLPLVIKGILTAEDAELAVAHGADAIVVSNHGGRQMDRAPASIDVLDEVVQAVGGRAEVYMDGGVRRGTDVLTALALGARAAFIGRPFLYALAVAGTVGVEHALGLLRVEIEMAMRLLGVTQLDQIRPEHLR